jgi:hypothetical protein
VCRLFWLSKDQLAFYESSVFNFDYAQGLRTGQDISQLELLNVFDNPAVLSSIFMLAASRTSKVTKSADIKVLGRLEDTKVARDWGGHDVLNIKDWTIKKNDQWVQQGINNKQDFYTASPIKGNLWDKAANRETVFSRELNQIKGAGYIKKGDTYVHP